VGDNLGQGKRTTLARPDLASTAQYIAWHARHMPDEPAIVEDDLFVSYRKLAEDLVRCVRAIEAMGIGPDRLAGIEHPRRYTHLLLLLACEVIGAATTSLAVGQNDELARYCDVILSGGDQAADAPPRTHVLPPDWIAGLSASPVHVDELTLFDRAVAPGRLARIVRTSGTTGTPKAIMLSRSAQLRRAMRSIDSVARDIPPNPKFLCLYSLTVAAVYWRVLGVLLHGGTVLFTIGRHAGALIAAGAVDYAMFAVGDIERFLENAAPPPGGHSLQVRVFGAALAPRLRQLILERLNAPVANPYATNETSTITMDSAGGALCAGVEARIVDDAGRDKPLGATGLVRVRTDAMAQGYFNDAAMTTACFIDGWFQTNDIGMIPEPGRLIVLGRADDMLNIGGVKVPPAPIEDQLKRIDTVSDAIVMSVAGPNDIGILLAAIEIGGDEVPADMAQQIGAIISRHVGRFEIMPLRSFPRTESGKTIRPEIEASFRRRQATRP
jgi:acyl-coenzyme A synthetase/AMP-(fatty) acid ligase